MEEEKIYKPEISVDCVVLGFDGERLKVLLVQRNGENNTDDNLNEYNNRKLPGSIILPSEDLDSAAYRILEECTGLTNIYLSQFKAFGKPVRNTEADMPWMEKVNRLGISRLVTVAYFALIKINNRVKQQSSQKGQTIWLNIEDYRLEHLAFDHKEIIGAALENIRRLVKFEPNLMFELLPKKFTMSQLRSLHDAIYQKPSDVRNFQKRMMQLEGISALPETEVGVPHRAARYFTYTKQPKRKK